MEIAPLKPIPAEMIDQNTPLQRSQERNRCDPRLLVLDLLNYIEQVEKLKYKPAFTVPTEFFVVYQHELKGLPELQFNLQGDGRTRTPGDRQDAHDRQHHLPLSGARQAGPRHLKR
jgi:hypothetical protein